MCSHLVIKCRFQTILGTFVIQEQGVNESNHSYYFSCHWCVTWVHMGLHVIRRGLYISRYIRVVLVKTRRPRRCSLALPWLGELLRTKVLHTNAERQVSGLRFCHDCSTIYRAAKSHRNYGAIRINGIAKASRVLPRFWNAQVWMEPNVSSLYLLLCMKKF